MIRRCEDSTRQNFERYGGRGIRVCEEWRGDGGFQRFIQHVGLRPSARHSIDRIDVNGNYQPGNVRWATLEEQARNKRNSVFITVGETTLTLGEWARRLGVVPDAIAWRLRRGWTPEKAVTTPSRLKRAAERRMAQQESTT